MAVQKLEKISQDIMNHHGEVLAKSIGDLLNPIQATNSITYDLFSTVARTVYDVATLPGRGTLSGLAMVLNLVKETMVEGNLNETQLEELVDHSTKFFTENADESPLKEGKGWVRYYSISIFQSLKMHQCIKNMYGGVILILNLLPKNLASRTTRTIKTFAINLYFK